MVKGGGHVRLAHEAGTESGSRDNSADSTFKASSRGKVGLAARYTDPIPPDPSTRSIR
jgi:hypothetical protein